MKLFEDYIENIENDDVITHIPDNQSDDIYNYDYVFVMKIENEDWKSTLEQQLNNIKKTVESLLDKTPQIISHSSVDFITQGRMFPDLEIIMKDFPATEEIAATWQAEAYKLSLRFFANCNFKSLISVLMFASNVQKACKKFDDSRRNWEYHPLMYSKNERDNKGHWRWIGTSDAFSIGGALKLMNEKKDINKYPNQVCGLFSSAYALVNKSWQEVWNEFVRLCGTDFSKMFMDAAFANVQKRAVDKHRTSVKLPKLFLDYAKTHPLKIKKETGAKDSWWNYYNCELAYTISPSHISRESYLRTDDMPMTLFVEMLEHGEIQTGIFDIKLVEGRIDFYFGLYLGIIAENEEYDKFMHVCIYYKDTLSYDENIKSICSVFGKLPGEDIECDAAAESLVNAMFEIANKD